MYLTLPTHSPLMTHFRERIYDSACVQGRVKRLSDNCNHSMSGQKDRLCAQQLPRAASRGCDLEAINTVLRQNCLSDQQQVMAGRTDHKAEGLTADAVMHAHEADVQTQEKYSVL